MLPCLKWGTSENMIRYSAPTSIYIISEMHNCIMNFWFYLKRHNQAKIIKKSVLFWLLNMAIRCEHIHILELGKSFKFWVLWQRSKWVESPTYRLFPYFLFWTCMSKLNFVFISRLTDKCATQNLIQIYTILVYGHVHIVWPYQEAKIKIQIFWWF